MKEDREPYEVEADVTAYVDHVQNESFGAGQPALVSTLRVVKLCDALGIIGSFDNSKNRVTLRAEVHPK